MEKGPAKDGGCIVGCTTVFIMFGKEGGGGEGPPMLTAGGGLPLCVPSLGRGASALLCTVDDPPVPEEQAAGTNSGAETFQSHWSSDIMMRS